MKKLLSVLLAVCMVFSMITVSAVSVGAADVGKGASTGASEKTIYVGVINYLTLKESDYQVRYWNGSGTGDVTLTATGETVQQAVGSAYWNNAAQTFKMYTATIPAEATGYKLHNGNTWFGENGDTAKNNTAYLFEYGGKHYAYYTTTEEPATEATEATTVAPVTRDHHFYVDFAEVIASGTTWYAWTWGEKSTGEWRPVEKFGYVSCHEYVLFASFAADTAPNWDSALSQTEDFTVEDDGRLRVLNEKDEQGHYKVKWNTEEPSTAAPATEAPTTVEPATDTPARLADGYYLIGIKGWDVDSIDAAQKFTENPGAEDEYLLETTLAENDTIKVVKVEKDVITEWYPDGTENEYKVDKAHSGEVTIYFQTTEKAEWKEFGGYFYVEAPKVPTEEPATEAPATDAPVTDAPATEAPATEVKEVELSGDYYLVGFFDGKDYSGTDYKFANGQLTMTFAADSYAVVRNAEGKWFMTDGFAGTDVTSATLYDTDITGENSDKLYVPAGKATFTLKAYSDGTFVLSYTVEEAPTTVAPTTEAPATVAPTTEAPTTEPATDAPARLADGYYLIGIKGWDVASIDAAQKFTENPGAEDEYLLETTLAENDTIKVVKVEKDVITEWYPDGTENEYKVDKAHSGEVTIYFQTTEKAEWKEFGGYFYVAAPEVPTDEPATEAPATDAPVTDAPATEAPATEVKEVELSGDYYLVGFFDGKDYSGTDYKFANGQLTMTFAADSYAVIRNAEGKWFMTDGFAGTNVTSATLYDTDITGENSDKLYVPAGKATFTLKAYSDGTFVLSYTVEEAPTTVAPTTEAPATVAPTTEAPTTVEPATDAPAKLADGYYLIGIKGWDVDSIDAAQKFTENPGAEDEYLLETTLAENDTIKVVKVEKDVITEWYPDGTENEYKVDKAHSGEVTIYFRTTEKDDWKEFGGYFYVEAPEVPTEEPATEAPATDAPVTDAPATEAPATEVKEVELSGDYYLVGFFDGKDYSGTDYKFANGQLTMTFAADSYAVVRNAEGKWFMTDGFAGTNVTSATLYDTDITGENSDKLYVPAGKATFTLKAYSDGTFVLSYTVEEAPATEAPSTEPATDAPARLADGYYLIGIKGWDVDSIDAAQKFTENPGAEDEYLLETTLAEDDTIKVVKVEKDVITEWYPDGTENEYKVDKAHSGEVTIYFRTTEKDDWKEFGGYFYVEAPEVPTEEPATEAPATDAPVTDAPATEAPATEVKEVELSGDYYLVGFFDGKDYSGTDYKFANGQLTMTFAADSYAVVRNAEGKWFMTDGFAGTNVTSATLYDTDITGENSDKLYVPAGKATFTLKAYSDGTFVLSYTVEEAPATEAPSTEPATDAPARLADGYYLIGIKGWNVDSIDAAQKFTENPGAEDEYLLETTLAENDTIKVVKVEKDVITEWYPDGTENEYKVDKAHSGEVTIYFQTTEKAEWKEFGGYFYVAAPEVPTEEPATEAPATDAPVTDAPATEAPATEVKEVELSGDYYLVGFFDGKDYSGTDYKFANGQLTMTFAADSYAVIRNAEGKWFMTDGFAGTNVTSATLYDTDITGENSDKLYVPAGKATFTLKAYSDGTFVLSYTVEEAPATEAPSTEPATDAPARLADGYYLIGIKGWDVDSIDAAQKFNENPGAEDEYLLETTLAENDTIKVVKVEKDVITEWYPDGTENEYKVDKAHSGEVTIYFRTTEKAEWKEFGGYFYVAAPEAPTDEPATEEPGTEPATDAPAKLADGYYLIGIKGWDVDSIDAAQKFTENPGAEDEYLLETTLAENDTIKVVKVEKDVITEWYPDGTGNEYKVDKAHSGEVTIYFQTTEKADWKEFGGYFYVAAPDEPLIGDVDGNGRVTIEDATMLQRYLAEFIDLTDDQKARADVTEDGRLSIKDVTAIQRMIAELPYK